MKLSSVNEHSPQYMLVYVSRLNMSNSNYCCDLNLTKLNMSKLRQTTDISEGLLQVIEPCVQSREMLYSDGEE